MTGKTDDAQNTAIAIAEHLASVRGATLPDSAIAAARTGMLDTFSVLTAGCDTPVMQKVLSVVRAWGGAEQATVWGTDLMTSDYAAAFANASMVHQYDFDDTHDTAVCHPTSASLTAALAVAEAEGGVSGELLVKAVVAGNDLSCRLAGAIDGGLWDFPWVRAPVVGIFGATAAAGVVLGLDAEQMHAALGIALPQAAGTLESVTGHRSMVRSMRDGLAYKDAVAAARLAQAGMRGDDRVFDGPYGLFGAYFQGRYRPEHLLDGLGARYTGEEVSLKPWPSCRHTHATITAYLDVLTRPEFADAEVARVTAFVGNGNLRLAEGKPWPANHIDALCHLPFVLAAATVHRAVPLRAFETEGREDPAVRAAAGRVAWELDPAHDRLGTIEPGRVRVEFADGRVAEGSAERGLGHPENPLSAEQQEAKWWDCAAHGAPHLTRAGAQRLFDAVRRVPQLDDVRALGVEVRDAVKD
ncbi:MmgE/PrpD family protein [Actinokineospora guangxiensis]|uniref:MmgE/PrpD family protein n=1 Tax=Actinokineospora guangxiensis TaxID=1490288 RepID=A0ABW0EW30_9PSEU